MIQTVLGGVLILDVETTGLLKKDLPIDHAEQPRLVEIAWTLYDQQGHRWAEAQTLVNPEVAIPAVAAGLHGLDERTLGRWGVKPLYALAPFLRALGMASEWVGYGDFEPKVIERELRLCGRPALEIAQLSRPRLVYRNLMQTVADLYFEGSWVKQGTAFRTVCGTLAQEAHRAASDRDELAQMFWKLRQGGKL